MNRGAIIVAGALALAGCYATPSPADRIGSVQVQLDDHTYRLQQVERGKADAVAAERAHYEQDRAIAELRQQVEQIRTSAKAPEKP